MGIDTVVVWPNGKAYFFQVSQYIRYDIATDKADSGYPLNIAEHWPGWPEFWKGADAAVVWPNGKAYFFRGSQYIRYDIAADKVDSGYPLNTAEHWSGWPASWKSVDTVVVWPNGKAYFFRGSQYIRYDIAADKVDSGYPLNTAEHWSGWPQSWKGVDAGAVWPNGKAYFFRGSQYIRYDIAADKVDSGYPLNTAEHWPGLSF